MNANLSFPQFAKSLIANELSHHEVWCARNSDTDFDEFVSRISVRGLMIIGRYQQLLGVRI
jgi:hypothetical protein